MCADLDALTGLAKAGGPLVFSAVYSLGQRLGRPGLGWSAAAAGAHALAQVLAHGPLARSADEAGLSLPPAGMAESPPPLQSVSTDQKECE